MLKTLRGLSAACLISGAALAGSQTPPQVDGLLYIANFSNSTVLQMTLDGAFSTVYSAADGLDGPFGSNALVRSPAGDLLVGNFNGRSIMNLDAGTTLADVGDGLTSPDALAYIQDVLYVANRESRNILRVGSDGTVTEFDTLPAAPMSLATHANILFVATSAGTIYRYDGPSAANRQLLGTFGPGRNVAIATSPFGTLYYLDRGYLSRVDASTGSATFVADGLGFAEVGMAYVPPAAGRAAQIFAVDYGGYIYRVNLVSGAVDTFAYPEDGLAGPSAILFVPTVNCGTFLRCDANCDGAVNFDDIDPFVVAQVSDVAYAELFPNCDYVCNNDANGDGLVNFDDLTGFIECLIMAGAGPDV